MRIIINDTRGREWQNLEKFWLMTKEKLERSDSDFELAFNRLLFISKSKLDLNNANNCVNLLLYLSIMYKATYQSLSILKAHETFFANCVFAKSDTMSELTLRRYYEEAFQQNDIDSAVSEEFYVRLSEMILMQLDKAHVLKRFMSHNRIVLLQFIARLKQVAIGYQQGNETKRRAYLFAKLLKLLRHVVQEQLGDTPEDATEQPVNSVNVFSILPNLEMKISLFDVGISMRNSKALLYEFKSDEAHEAKQIEKTQTAYSKTIPNKIQVWIDQRKQIGSLRKSFEQGIVSLHSKQAPAKTKTSYYLAANQPLVWRLLKTLYHKVTGLHAKLMHTQRQ